MVPPKRLTKAYKKADLITFSPMRKFLTDSKPIKLLLEVSSILPISFWLSRPFSINVISWTICALLLTLVLVKSWHRFCRHRQSRQTRDHYLCLLQFLCGELAAGSNLYRALLRADQILPEQLGKNSAVYRAIHLGCKRLRLQEDSAPILREIGRQIGLAEALDLFFLLAGSEALGDRHFFLLRDAASAQQKITAIERESKSEQFAVIAEALVLLATPFAMGHAFKGMYRQLDIPHQQPAALICTTAAFLASLFAIGQVIRILWPRERPTPRKELKRSDFARHFYRFCCTSQPVRWLAKKLVDRLPPAYNSRLRQQHKLLINRVEVTEDVLTAALNKDLSRRLTTLIWLTILLLFPLLLGRLPPSLLFLLPASWFYFDYHQQQEVRNLIRQFQKDLAFYLEALLQYMTGGFVPLKAMAAAVQSGKDMEKPLYDLLGQLVKEIEFSGNFAKQVLQFSLRLNDVTMQTIFLLLSQYAENGHEESLSALHSQKYVCWDLYRRSLQAEQKLTAGKLLLPMATDLLAVMLIALAPALSVFSTF